MPQLCCPLVILPLFQGCLDCSFNYLWRWLGRIFSDETETNCMSEDCAELKTWTRLFWPVMTWSISTIMIQSISLCFWYLEAIRGSKRMPVIAFLSLGEMPLVCGCQPWFYVYALVLFISPHCAVEGFRIKMFCNSQRLFCRKAASSLPGWPYT